MLGTANPALYELQSQLCCYHPHCSASSGYAVMLIRRCDYQVPGLVRFPLESGFLRASHTDHPTSNTDRASIKSVYLISSDRQTFKRQSRPVSSLFQSYRSSDRNKIRSSIKHRDLAIIPQSPNLTQVSPIRDAQITYQRQGQSHFHTRTSNHQDISFSSRRR